MLEDSPADRFLKSNKTWTEYIREEIFKTMETAPWEPDFDIWKSIFKTWSQSEVRPRSPDAPTLAHMVQGESMYDPEYEKRWSKYHYERCSGLDKHNLRFSQKVEIAASNDDKVLFLQLVKDIHTDLRVVCELWYSLFKFDAVDCVAAVLDGETKGLLEFPPCTVDGIADPMELATDFNAYRLINLLLDRFGPHVANIRVSGLRLPLNNALFNPSVDPTASIFEELWLISELYNRPKLESVRILAHHTEDLEKEFIKYAMEGKTRQVVTLLLVARQKVSPLCSGLRKPILEEITSLLSHDVSSALTSETDFFTHKRMSLQLILAWFEILEKVGDELLPYLSLPKDDETFHNELCDMLKRAGFSIAYMNDYATNLSYWYLPELFRDQKIIMPSCLLEHEGDIRDGAVIGVEGCFDPKVENELEESIGADDSNNFVSIVAYRMKRECLSENNSLFAGELLRSICYHNSVECATVLLEGKTDVRIELNTALEDGSYPIHLAATSLSPGLTELFLLHGAQTNVQCNNSSSPCYGMFPLELALEALRFHRSVGEWMPTKSIFKLIYIFCLPELMGPLKTIELLSCDIPVVQKICSHCVQKGKLVELCALLMVSWDMLVSPGHEGDIGSSFIGKHIISELQMLAIEEAKFICTNDAD